MGLTSISFAIIGGLLLAGVPGVGPLLAILWVAGCYFASRTLRSNSALVIDRKLEPVDEPNAVRVLGRSPDKAEHVPPAPHGEVGEPWSPDTRQLEVAGEWYRRDNLRQLFAREGALSPAGAEQQHDAALVPDPGNPHDRHAVAVYVEGLHVGYMERADAARYHGAVAALQARGIQTTVRSRQWVRAAGHELWARVTIWLPDPEGFAPANAVPDDALVLPTGTAVQATQEEAHIDILAPLVARTTRVPVAATLHAVTESRPRSTIDLVEVRLDGRRVGVLTPTQTSNIMPLVHLANRCSRTATARAVVHGNSLKADVTLYVSKAQDVDPKWIAAVGG